MNFSLHCSIRYFKNNKIINIIVSQNILNLFFFLIMHLFGKISKRNIQDGQTSDISKRDLNVHFILRNSGHA